MYLRQRGLVPVLASSVGLLTFLAFIGLEAVGVMRLIVQASEFAPHEIVVRLVRVVGLGLPFLLVGMLFAGLFPEIRIVKDGIKYRFLTFVKGTIRWEEIEEVIEFSSGYIALAISRKGLYLLNGLYLNRLYGQIIRHEQPVLFLAPQTEDKQQVLAAIKSKSKARFIRIQR